ncbi:Aldolase-type TIM barrel [Acididesulfobacillus acetoxydans]|uniref:Aldolase-type TIM barrel n=1 Tax=Acididesulfobacillus acetoxydans TaxID=1561005 RepID=A0A8S0VVK1_9FIRM|nr:radical SAM protein [Acididesulfobacillus acetoxydans]CAA7599683.1 Aldolase-type TIM barrel [Acididesulfobacillus acetoxydans]CEJ06235.1 Radical SAM [Acididesulfobacillus acetoxydans]
MAVDAGTKVNSDINQGSCRACPRECGKDRTRGEKGVCGAAARAKVARASLHAWEEPCVSGSRGSGTVFFSHCNLSCVFCQNYEISQEGFGREVTVGELAEIFLNLQAQGAHNINLVSPMHYPEPVREALIRAGDRGLRVPVIYNTNAYEKAETLRRLEGLVDVYLPDLKYFSDEYARRYSRAEGYFAWASQAILEMLRQVGAPRFDEDGLIERGLLVRHLVLPGLLADSKAVLRWIAEKLPRDVYVSLMGQYTPVYQASRCPELARPLTEEEYDEAIDFFFSLGLENGFAQELDSGDPAYIPEFDLSGVRTDQFSD